MKKHIALLLAVLLIVGLTACGITDDGGGKTTTTVTDATTTATETPSSTTVATSVVVGTDTNGSTVTSIVEIPTTTTTTPAVTGGVNSTTTTTTTVYVPSGATVPIGTKPTGTTTTATTKAPTTTAPAEEPTGSSATTTTTTTAPTTTTTTTKPTEPEGPYIVLPEIGSDIDVTKKKDRIRVSGVSAWFNDDSTIGVSLTFKNYTSNWITEESDWVAYTCYDKNGNVVQAATKIMIGCIDTKKNSEKSFTFDVPANTAEVRFTDSKIVYWTEWS